MSTRIALVCALAAAVASAGCGDLSRSELRRGVGTLKSIAAEGELLAVQVARARVEEVPVGDIVDVREGEVVVRRRH
jgi:hypothetical protein